MKGKYLITTDSWFYGKDGLKYKSVWGEVTVLGDDILGVKTNRNSANWFIKVSGETESLLIAGCQVFYALQCDEPDFSEVEEKTYGAEGVHDLTRPSEIYKLL